MSLLSDQMEAPREIFVDDSTERQNSGLEDMSTRWHHSGENLVLRKCPLNGTPSAFCKPGAMTPPLTHRHSGEI